MSNLTQLQVTQKEIQAKMESLKQDLVTLGEKLFREGAQDIFDTYPDLLSFSWTQYTPYFNDGEECVFSVHASYGINLTYKDGDKEVDPYEDGEADEEDFSSYNAKYADPSVELPSYYQQYENKRWLFAAGATCSSLISGVDEDTMKALFGDHVRVTVNREGIDVTDYDHD